MTIDSADDSKISNWTINTNRISNRTYDSKSNRITMIRRSLRAILHINFCVKSSRCWDIRLTMCDYYIVTVVKLQADTFAVIPRQSFHSYSVSSDKSIANYSLQTTTVEILFLCPDSLLRLWHYINHLLTYSLICCTKICDGHHYDSLTFA